MKEKPTQQNIKSKTLQSSKKKYSKPLHLEMPFDEALNRLARVKFQKKNKE